jgi:AcrR family transcriptional regulator
MTRKAESRSRPLTAAPAGASAAGTASGDTRIDSILAEGAKLFAARGFSATSMQDLADAVGVTKSALYYFFRDKDEIYERIVMSTLEDLNAAVREAVEREMGARDKILAAFIAHARFFSDNLPRYVATALGFAGVKEMPARVQANALRDQYEQTIRNIIREGSESGELRCVDPVIASRAILSCLNWMARWWKPTGPLSAEDIARQYADLLLAGLLNDQTATDEAASIRPPYTKPAQTTVERQKYRSGRGLHGEE